MDEYVISSADIENLKKEARKLGSGEMVVGRLISSTINDGKGMPIVRKSFVTEYREVSHETIDFQGADLTGEGINGRVNVDAFKKAKKSSTKFNLKKNFLDIIDKIETRINYYRLNYNENIFLYDEFGRVYFKCDDIRYYVNNAKTGCLSENGEYANLVYESDSSFHLEFDETVDTTYFSYMYISKQAELEDIERINIKDEEDYQRFISENPIPDFNKPKSNVINIEDYRKGHSR